MKIVLNGLKKNYHIDIIDDFYVTSIKMKKYNKSPTIKFKIMIRKRK